MKRLILNADDFGIGGEENRIILALAHQQLITSVSVIMTDGAVLTDAEDLAEIPGLSIGIHLNLTQYSSTRLPKGKSFFQGKRAFWTHIDEELFDLSLMSDECLYQIERFEQLFGRLPTHIDGHNHIHVASPVLSSMIHVANRFGLTRVRIPQDVQSADIPDGDYRSLVQGWESLATDAQYIYRRHGIRSPDHFRGLAFFANPSVEAMLTLLEQIPEQGVTELMVHPGYTGRRESGVVVSEYDILTNDRVREMISLCECVSYEKV